MDEIGQHDTQFESAFFNPSNWSQLLLGSQNIQKKTNKLLSVSQTEGSIVFRNDTDEKARFKLASVFQPPCEGREGALFQLSGSARKGTGCVWVNKSPLPLNGKATIPCGAKSKFRITFECAAHSEIAINACELVWSTAQINLVDECSKEPRVLVVVPDYPTEANLYLAAFAHSRNRRYIQAGLNIQVAVIKSGKRVQTSYVMDGVPVVTGGLKDLKALIGRKQYQAIVVHFVDLLHYDVFDGYITNEQLIFICHGPETSFPCLPNVARPYFSKPIDDPPVNQRKIDAVRRYAQKDNVDWVFVSQWLMDESEKLMGVEFKNKHCIHNVVDEGLFPYREKDADNRKKILMLRRFDDNCYHSVDIAIECILSLSRRPFFDDLQFEIVGDGKLFPLITAPVKDFPNVSLRRTFVPNSKISEVHAENGILLAPSRHDSQGVSSCEGASSGLVVIGSDVTCCSYFFDEETNHTLAPPEDPDALADIIERLYYNPAEYQAISQRMSKRMRELCSVSQTTEREIELIVNSRDRAAKRWGHHPHIFAKAERPVLTIGIPAYNVENFIAKCLYSLLNQRNAGKMEILVLNDGSTDRTREIAEQFQTASPDIVRVINKPNGGYGSAVNVAISEARGTFFRIVDGDDWLMSENLAILIDKLEEEAEADLVLTLGKHEQYNTAKNTIIQDYDMLSEGRLYHFDDLTYPGYGFKTYGAILSSSTYRTSCIQRNDMTLTEHSPYVDMEYNAFGIRDIDRIRYYNLDIYRYFMGREGQSISLDSWRRNYKNHRAVIFNILRTIFSDDQFTSRRRDYVVEHIVAPMVDSQLIMYDKLRLWDDIPLLMQELEPFPSVKSKCEAYIRTYAPKSIPILKYYRNQLALPKSERRSLHGAKSSPKKVSIKHRVRRTVQALAPYGIIKRRQEKRIATNRERAAEQKAWKFN